MVKTKLRYYTYKVTFKDLPCYFYYGKHKDSGTQYFGSPKTWKHLWDQFEPEVQILQWYETEKEVADAEDKIIESTWKSPYSLNEHCGGHISEDLCRVGGTKGGNANTLLQQETRSKNAKSSFPKMLAHPNTLESMSRNGRKSLERQRRLNLGFFNPEVAKKAGSAGGSANTDLQREAQRETARKINRQLWVCLVSGRVANPGNLTKIQKSMGIDTSLRKRFDG